MLHRVFMAAADSSEMSVLISITIRFYTSENNSLQEDVNLVTIN